MEELKVLKDALNAALIDDWQVTPITTASHHLWRLEWYRAGDGVFVFAFISLKWHRRYVYHIDGGRVIGIDIVSPDSGARLAWYHDAYWDTDRLPAIVRFIPRPVQRRMQLLLDAINIDIDINAKS